MAQAPGIGNVISNPGLVQMAMAYSRSRIVCAAARLGIADVLRDDERSVDELAAACAADPSALHRLLRALASFGVVEEVAIARFRLTAFGQPLRKDAPQSAWFQVVFWADLLADEWSHLTDCIRTGKPARDVRNPGCPSRWSQDPDANSIFRAVMGTAPVEDYEPIAQAWDFSQAKVVADLGGGGGALLHAILRLNPHLRGMLVDRPESIERAKPRFAAEDLASRAELIAADLDESVPAGADVLIMKHVLHGYQDADAIDVLRNCRAVLPPNGHLLIVEFLLPPIVDHADPALEGRLMSDLNMLAVTGGKERTEVEWRALLEPAGFALRQTVPVGAQHYMAANIAMIAAEPV
jgi:2-polyprenyl-3-methyl-5-hydroxy-6-metoxy-1,4-benzoquinol methylase